jgi:hypothetical protein
VLAGTDPVPLTTAGRYAWSCARVPATISLAGRHMTITGQATGFFFVGASLGNMGLPWLIGQRFVLDGPPVVMLSIAIDLALAIGVFSC